MGILQSVLQYLNSEPDEVENATSPLKLEQHHQWRNRRHPTLSHNSKHLTITVPKLRDSSSHPHTSVNHELKGSASLVKPQNTSERIRIGSCSGEEKQREEGSVIINCTVVAPVGRWIKHYSSCHLILLVGDGDFSFSTCLAAAFGWASC